MVGVFVPPTSFCDTRVLLPSPLSARAVIQVGLKALSGIVIEVTLVFPKTVEFPKVGGD